MSGAQLGVTEIVDYAVQEWRQSNQAFQHWKVSLASRIYQKNKVAMACTLTLAGLNMLAYFGLVRGFPRHLFSDSIKIAAYLALNFGIVELMLGGFSWVFFEAPAMFANETPTVLRNYLSPEIIDQEEVKSYLASQNLNLMSIGGVGLPSSTEAGRLIQAWELENQRLIQGPQGVKPVALEIGLSGILGLGAFFSLYGIGSLFFNASSAVALLAVGESLLMMGGLAYWRHEIQKTNYQGPRLADYLPSNTSWAEKTRWAECIRTIRPDLNLRSRTDHRCENPDLDSPPVYYIL